MTLVLPGAGRATLQQANGALTISIPIKFSGYIIPFMMAWLVGWAFGEYSALSHLLFDSPGPQIGGRLFLMVWLIGWTIAGPYALWSTLWMVFGREHITVGLSQLEHRRQIFGLFYRHRGYLLDQISKIRIAPAVANKLRGRYQTPLPDASSVTFDYGRSTIVLTPGIDEAEANYIVNEMCKFSPHLRTSR